MIYGLWSEQGTRFSELEVFQALLAGSADIKF